MKKIVVFLMALFLAGNLWAQTFNDFWFAMDRYKQQAFCIGWVSAFRFVGQYTEGNNAFGVLGYLGSQVEFDDNNLLVDAITDYLEMYPEREEDDVTYTIVGAYMMVLERKAKR